MKLYSWNVNGIRAVNNKGLLIPFLEEHQPDVLCLQETKVQPDQIDFEIPGYYVYWNSAIKKGYSSTAILSRIEPIKIINGFPESIIKKHQVTGDTYGNPNDEGRVAVAEFDKFYVATVYTPNSKGDLSRLKLRYKHWDPAFLEYMKELEKTKPVLFSGDLNVAHTEDDLANPKPNVGKHGFTKEEREGFDNFVKAGFVDTFRMFTKGNGHYTWWTHWANARARNVGWRIDYWLASKSISDKIVSSRIHPEVMGSDHCPVSIELSI
ncbi:exodeoxyribonuclease III [Candidatus Nomurabacteria bacterium]|nr:exodeoxyribonuclease III [Candidatus Nomurabacteria bacterium]